MKNLIVALVTMLFLVGCATFAPDTPSQAERRAICQDNAGPMDERQTWCGTTDNSGPDPDGENGDNGSDSDE